jgi:hypothetical protein
VADFLVIRRLFEVNPLLPLNSCDRSPWLLPPAILKHQYPFENLYKSTQAEAPANRKFRGLTFGGHSARVGGALRFDR